jgi:hypothetical protein
MKVDFHSVTNITNETKTIEDGRTDGEGTVTSSVRRELISRYFLPHLMSFGYTISVTGLVLSYHNIKQAIGYRMAPCVLRKKKLKAEVPGTKQKVAHYCIS